MAGKTKRRGGGEASRSVTPSTPASPTGFPDSGLKGHLALKSSPYAPTDCKLVSQYMVLDHMSAHYKKVNNAKSCVDTTPPKAWLASQKVRDRMRRQTLQTHMKRREAWMSQPTSARASSRASSDADRREMLAMLESMDGDEDYDVPDARANATYDTLEVNPPYSQQDSPGMNNNDYDKLQAEPNEQDMKLINKIIADNTMSPSKYHSLHSVTSNIPGSRDERRGQQMMGGTTTLQHTNGMGRTYARAFSATIKQDTTGRGPVTPRNRSKDLLDTHSHKFAQEKPFQPRTLKTKVTSKLSEFKYYNPPKRQTEDGAQNGTVESGSLTRNNVLENQQRHGVSGSGFGGLRPTTPMTESIDLANETIMSRDAAHATPTGIPRLDISLDQDHMKWLKEQSKKAHVRSATIKGHSSRSDLGSDVGSVRGMGSTRGMGSLRSMTDTQRSALMNQTQGQETMRKTMKNFRTQQLNNGTPLLSPTMHKMEQEEDELRYLEFISEVTNDVLDRGIFTNRVLKQVFEIHVERRRHDLKVSRMRDMLEELRRDLGIPPEDQDEEEKFGLATTRKMSVDELASTSNVGNHTMMNNTRNVENSLNGLNLDNKREDQIESYNSATFGATLTSQKMPVPKPQKSGRPPLPRPHPRSRGRSGSLGSSSFTSPHSSMDIKEEPAVGESHLGDLLENRVGETVFGDTLTSELDNYEEVGDVVDKKVTVQVESNLDKYELHHAYADTLKTDEETEEWDEEDTPRRPTPRARGSVHGSITSRTEDRDSVHGDYTSRTEDRDSERGGYTSRTEEFSSHSDSDSPRPEEPMGVQEGENQLCAFDEVDRGQHSDGESVKSARRGQHSDVESVKSARRGQHTDDESVQSARHEPPVPTPRRRSSTGLGKTMGISKFEDKNDAKSTLTTEEAKSTARTEEFLSESVEVSELDDDDDENF